ncbi:HU family DNA-binding protein [Desulfomonile tiedjei]|uniref:Bacterial nucleoid DNA-binding protein n=1 Tax=Desulfomonile tiedjei (strain ATCC 49306 / DSM 6799 / DCB-1) TaxID=706587 RepID=I4C0K7_DESTA|nr:HU family DNA-binding protein [Desulfomonile tiedjei]AFM23098.1 bacterial nucleoid DNA-binding protein [Desulfomonile tiedjei DSM 6799]
MTKTELVTRVAGEAGLPKKTADSVLKAFVAAIHQSLKGKDGQIRIPDLGTFLVAQRKARKGVNPQTKKKIKIPASKVPRFRAAKALREAAKQAV